MALLAAEGFDDLSTTRTTTMINKEYFNGTFCYTFQGHSGTTSRYSTGRTAAFTNYEYWGVEFASTKQEIYTAMAFYRVDSPASYHNVFALYDGASAQCGVACNNVGALVAWRNTTATVLATSASGVCPQGSWVWVSAYVKIDNTVGRIEIYVDGTKVIDFTGDTQQTANAYCNRFFFDQGTNLQGVKDDVFVMDTSGSTFNGHMIAEHRIIPLTVTADGYVSNWTASSGADYTTVDEIPWSDTDYIASSTAGQKSTFTFSDLPASTNAILAVFLSCRALRDDTTARSFRDILRISSADYNGVTWSVASTAKNYCGKLHETNPATAAAWTESEVNALEGGVELIS